MKAFKQILLLLLVLFPVCGMAQEKYTDELKRQNASGAVVVVHQDAELEDLVNGVTSPVLARDTVSVKDIAKKPEKTSGPHTKTNGYRVQIYMGGNTASDAAQVKGIAKRFKTYFPSVNAYVYFNSPHWVCAAGDFKSRTDAQELLMQVRSNAQFKSASIVRSKINEFH